MVRNQVRLRELDFLRGIAIILVLLRHGHINKYLNQFGWIGVDLFFVLIGFLVSGLLFKEYLRNGTINPKKFLIRRGFKIYPIYYLSYPIYLIFIFIAKKVNFVGVISDLFFIQNYVMGWGYAYEASWSLAIEEHFYFGFSILLYLGIKKKYLKIEEETSINKLAKIEVIILVTMIACLILRILSNLYLPFLMERNITMTHLRIDSLLAGVWVSFLYYFKYEYFQNIFLKYKPYLLFFAFSLLSFTPFLEPNNSFFVKTLGFTFLFISFGLILSYFLLDIKINATLNKIFSRFLVNFISKIGFCSYSIYIIHTFSNRIISQFQLTNFQSFVISTIISVSVGMTMTYKIESYFLRIR